MGVWLNRFNKVLFPPLGSYDTEVFKIILAKRFLVKGGVVYRTYVRYLFILLLATRGFLVALLRRKDKDSVFPSCLSSIRCGGPAAISLFNFKQPLNIACKSCVSLLNWLFLQGEL